MLLLPYLEKMVGVGTRVVAWLQRMDGGTRKWIMGIGLAVAAMGPALVVIGKLTSGIGRMVGVVGKLTMAFGKGGKAAPAWARGIAAVTKGLASFVKQAALAIASIVRQAAAWVAETAAKVAATAATVAHSAATKAAAAAQWLLNAALTANPIGLVVAAVAALVAVIVVLWKKNETFRKVVIGRLGRDQERRRGGLAGAQDGRAEDRRRARGRLGQGVRRRRVVLGLGGAVHQGRDQAVVDPDQGHGEGHHHRRQGAVEGRHPPPSTWFWGWAGPFIKGARQAWWTQFAATITVIGRSASAWAVIKRWWRWRQPSRRCRGQRRVGIIRRVGRP